MFYASILFGASFILDVPDAINRLKNHFFPPQSWECPQDKNIKGFILDDDPKYNHNLLFDVGQQTPLIPLKNQKLYDKALNDDKTESQFKFCFGDLDKKEWECFISIEFDESSELLLSTRVFDETGKIACEIKDNFFILNKNCAYKYNLDERGIELIDDELDVIFNLDLKNDTIRINGIFYNDRIAKIALQQHGINQTIPIDENKKQVLEYCKEQRGRINKIFCYEGRDWFRKRAPCK